MAMDQAYGAGGGCFRLAAYRHPRKAGQLESQGAERLMAAAQNQRNFSTRSIGVLIIVVLSFGLLSGCSGADLPAFDAEKAKALSEEKRRAYDLIYFNEMATWNLSTNRHITEYEATHPKELGKDVGRFGRKREEEFRAMALDGYLPAYVALRLFDLQWGKRFADKQAALMLLDAGENGDVSAMCAAGIMAAMKELNEKLPDFAERRGRLLTRGAEQGHGACLAVRGARFRYIEVAPDGIPVLRQSFDAEKGLPDLLESARQGYYSAHVSLYHIRELELERKNFQVSGPLELERVLCWGRLAQQHSNWAGFDVFLSKLNGILPRDLYPDRLDRIDPAGSRRAKVPPEYFPLLDAYDPSKIPITRKLVTTEKCIGLERQGAQQ